MITRALLFAAASLLCALAGAAGAGLQDNVVFSDYSPLARSTEIARRLLSPLAALHVEEFVSSGAALHEQRVDLAEERFALYVPPAARPQGYALLVFVPPWEAAVVPRIWTAALDRHHMIFVSAARSGNAADVLNRREPLALLAAYNIMQRYAVDPQQVYVGGFSGGARMALRLALAYPDLFHGALLNASSDPIGNEQIPLPPRQLLEAFQEASRLVFVTGAQDTVNVAGGVLSRQSLQGWCVFDLITESVPWAAHEILDLQSFNRALDALVKHSRPDAKKLAACRARIDAALTADLQQVQDLLAAGKPQEARRLLRSIDAHYGGLAAPRSIELAHAIG